MEKKLQNSIDYLNKMSDKKSGFSIPMNYFDTLEDNFEIKLLEDNFIKDNGFKLPENYLNSIENNVIAKVFKEKKSTKVITLKEKLLNFIPLAAAASVILFITINSFVFENSNTDPFNNLADIEVENWISENIYSITDNDLTIAYTDVEFDETEFVPNSITDDEIENYLNNQNDISLILEND